MTLIEFSEDLFFVAAFLNIILAIWSAVEWGISYKINHTKYRWLYSVWIVLSLSVCALYVGITLNTTPGNILNAPWYMVLIRPVLGLILSSSAITAEVLRAIRIKRVLNDFK